MFWNICLYCAYYIVYRITTGWCLNDKLLFSQRETLRCWMKVKVFVVERFILKSKFNKKISRKNWKNLIINNKIIFSDINQVKPTPVCSMGWKQLQQLITVMLCVGTTTSNHMVMKKPGVCKNLNLKFFTMSKKYKIKYTDVSCLVK